MTIRALVIGATYVDARDVATAHVLAAENDAAGRFIVNENALTFREFAAIMHDVDPSVPRSPFTLPRFTAPMMPWADAMFSKLLGTARMVTRDATPGMRLRYDVSAERARAVLGWSPAFDTRTSLADTMEALRAYRQRSALGA